MYHSGENVIIKRKESRYGNLVILQKWKFRVTNYSISLLLGNKLCNEGNVRKPEYFDHNFL